MFERGAHETNVLSPEKLVLFAERYAGKARQLVAHAGEGVYGTLSAYSEEMKKELKKYAADNGKEKLFGLFSKAAALSPTYSKTLKEMMREVL